jgi:hypothetical protein
MRNVAYITYQMSGMRNIASITLLARRRRLDDRSSRTIMTLSIN